MLQPLIFRGLRGTNTRRIARYILSPKRFHQLGRDDSLSFLPVEEEYDEDPGRLENDEFSGVSRLAGYLYAICEFRFQGLNYVNLHGNFMHIHVSHEKKQNS